MARRMPDYQRQWSRELRQEQTETELLLWNALRSRKLSGLKFRRQRPLGRYIADFCCDARKLVIEIDGAVHDTPDHKECDALRDAMMNACHYTVLRVRTSEVEASLDNVLVRIQEAANVSNTVTPSPAERSEGTRGEGAGG